MFNYLRCCVCPFSACGCCVYLTFVPLCRRWAGIYPVATNAADRKDETGRYGHGGGEEIATGHMDNLVCVHIGAKLKRTSRQIPGSVMSLFSK